MKKLRIAFVALVIAAMGSNVSAKEFDWSKCWCTFGGGIQQGDVLLSINTAPFTFLDGFQSTDAYSKWTIPYTEVNLDFATYVGKLPFTFGGYAGVGINGTDFKDSNMNDLFYFNLYTGAEALYHMSFPPSKLDVYGGIRMGLKIGFGSYNNFGFDWGIVGAGARYFFTDKFAANLEFGYPYWIKAGITLKF